jgi:hypothetical protein
MDAGCGDERAKENGIEQMFRRHGDSIGWTGFCEHTERKPG